MEIETRRLADLKPADYNPRKKLEPGDPEYEKIARSIEEFGYCDPIIINREAPSSEDTSGRRCSWTWEPKPQTALW